MSKPQTHNPTICIIKALSKDGENHHGIDAKNWNQDDLSHYKLKENIEDHVQFVKLNTIYDLLNAINVEINPSDKYIVNVDDLYYTSDYVYQAIFKSVAKDVNCSYISLIEDSNKIATQLIGEKHMVDGNMIIIKRSIINNDFEYVDVTFDDVTDILKSRFFHTALITTPSPTNSVEENSYVYNPLEINFGQTHIDNVRYHEFKFLEYRLFFHVDTKAERTDLNKLASIIYGTKIYGNTLISLSDNSDSSPVNLDLTKDIINMIVYITIHNKLSNSFIDRKLYSRNLNLQDKKIEDYDSSKHNHFYHNNFPEITLCPNFFQIIKEEYNRIKNINSFDLVSVLNNLDMTIFTDTNILNDII